MFEMRSDPGLNNEVQARMEGCSMCGWKFIV